LTPNELAFTFGSSYLRVNFGKIYKKCDRETARRRIHTLANRRKPIL